MGARKKTLNMTDLYLLDFDQIEQEWWQDYSEDLPEQEKDYNPTCCKCLGKGCSYCLMLDPNRIA
jgi:hypothetical protein